MSVKDLEEKDTVSYYVHALVNLYANKTAIIWRSGYRRQLFSHRDLYNDTRRVVTLLHSMGIRKGDRVCVWAYNSPVWVEFFLGCSISGIILVPIDFHSGPEFASFIIRKVGAKTVLLSRFKDVDEPIPKLYMEDFSAILKNTEPIPLSQLPQIEPEDLLEIVFTSGTTGDPKGVMITNRNLVTNIRSMRNMMPLDDSYRFLSMIPLSHMLEQVVGMLNPLRFGASLVYTRTRKPSEFIKCIKKYRVTTLVTVPLFLDSVKNTILRKARERRLDVVLERMLTITIRFPLGIRKMLWFFLRRGIGRDLRFFISGGARLFESTEDFWNALGIKVLQGYGLTEASPVVSCNVLGQHKARTVGKVVPGVEIRRAEDGELLIRGPNITRGYYQNEEATKAAFKESWYKTGDIGELDGDGFLVLKGRKKDMILTGTGFNIFPQDIEMVLNGLPSVKESCVLAIEEEGMTKIHAAIISEPSGTDTIEQILRMANEKLDSYHRIHAAAFWPAGEFPKTPSLKIKRHEVAKAVEDMRKLEKQTAPLAVEEKGIPSNLCTIISSLSNIPPSRIKEDSRLVDDLGLDSLALAELVVMIEEWFHVDFDESNLRPETTISDLQVLIKAASTRGLVRLPEVSWARTFPVVAARDILQRICSPYVKSVLDLKVKGQDFLSGLTSPAIFAANHVGFLDTFAILWSLPSAVRRQTAVAAAAEIYFGLKDGDEYQVSLPRRVLGSTLVPLLLNIFPLSRKTLVSKSLALMGELLDDGWSVLIYPEGERSLSGEMSSFKPGIGLVAAEMLVPIVPIKLSGSFNPLPESLSHRSHATVSFGKPLCFGGRNDYSAIAREIEAAIRSL